MRDTPFRLALMWPGGLCLSAPAQADVTPALLFNDNAVLQRDKPIPVCGTADVGGKVSVTFADHTVATTADVAGQWRVDLPALAANATPAELFIMGKNTLKLTNILVGEWRTQEQV
jgi:sialate O-acetylesterase